MSLFRFKEFYQTYSNSNKPCYKYGSENNNITLTINTHTHTHQSLKTFPNTVKLLQKGSQNSTFF